MRGPEQSFYDWQWHYMRAIWRRVEVLVGPAFKCQAISYDWLKPNNHFVQIRPLAEWSWHFPAWVHTPGIPDDALVPDKVEPIAQWIYRQVQKERPEWFENTDP